MRALDWLIGFERGALWQYLGDAPRLIGGVEHLSGRTAALPVDDRHETRGMMREIVFAIMRYRS